MNISKIRLGGFAAFVIFVWTIHSGGAMADAIKMSADSFAGTSDGFRVAYPLGDGSVNVVAKYDAEMPYAPRMKTLHFSDEKAGEIHAWISWGQQACLTLHRRKTRLEFCFETAGVRDNQRSMVMQADLSQAMGRGPQQSKEDRIWVRAHQLNDVKSLAAHPYTQRAIEILTALDTPQLIGSRFHAQLVKISARVNGKEHQVKNGELAADIGDQLILEIGIKAEASLYYLDRVQRTDRKPQVFKATLSQADKSWKGVCRGWRATFDVGKIDSLRIRKYRLEVDGQVVSGKMLHRLGRAIERRLAKGTSTTWLEPPAKATAENFERSILEEIEKSYDSDRHRLGVDWVTQALAQKLRARKNLSSMQMKLLQDAPEHRLTHLVGAANLRAIEKPLRHADLRFEGPYADTFANTSSGPDVIWEDKVAYSLFSALRFDDLCPKDKRARAADFLKKQIDKQIEPTSCVHSKNLQCHIDTKQSVGHGWALLAFTILASDGDKQAGELAQKIVDHLGKHHLGEMQAEPASDYQWERVLHEAIVSTTALRLHANRNPSNHNQQLFGRAQSRLFALTTKGYRRLSLNVLVDLFDYLKGSSHLLEGILR